MDVGRFFISATLASHAAPFRRALLRWYKKNGRDLPWRRTRDPYSILVSEFMLQQTQVATVVPYYKAWLKRFPDFISLARAEESEVLLAWQGLGYYARARNLHATAKIIVSEHGGLFPECITALHLPGLGRYSANAVATFAFDQPVPIVEANIARLFSRLIDLQIPIDSAAGRATLWNAAAALVPKRRAAEYNSALMDLGALICVSRQPKCVECPVKKYCRAKVPAALPMKTSRAPTQFLTEQHLFASRRGRVLLEQSAARWCGMWILPPLPKTQTDRPLHTSEFPFTHHRITLAVYRQSPRGVLGPAQRWFPIGALNSIPMPSPHRRAMETLLRSLN